MGIGPEYAASVRTSNSIIVAGDNQTARDVETFNLDRKPLVFNVFRWLAEASRG